MKAAVLRWAEPKDMKAVLGLIQELADFEKEPEAVVISEDDLLEHAFGGQPKFQCFVAEKQGQVVGMAILPVFHLESANSFRRFNRCSKGARYRFRKALYQIHRPCRSTGGKRIEWVVLD